MTTAMPEKTIRTANRAKHDAFVVEATCIAGNFTFNPHALPFATTSTLGVCNALDVVDNWFVIGPPERKLFPFCSPVRTARSYTAPLGETTLHTFGRLPLCYAR
jgi:hypothetical protein